MKRLLLAILAALWVAWPALADWGPCETGDATSIGKGGHICYTFSDSDATASIKSFDVCYDVDVVYFNDGETEDLCIDVCTNTTTGTCTEIVSVCISGDDGDSTYTGLPGTMLRPRLEPGTVAGAGNPQARFTCN